MTESAINELISHAVEGCLTAAEAAQLTASIREDGTILASLASQLSTHRLMQTLGADADGRLTAQEVTLRLEQQRLEAVTNASFVLQLQNRLQPNWWKRAAVAAALVATAATVTWRWSSSNQPHAFHPAVQTATTFSADGPPSEPRPAIRPMALLQRGADAVWANGTDYSVGELLPAGWLRLKSGTVQLELISGAQILLTGPAELRLDGENAAFLKTGKASASVPEAAHGFLLAAPGMQVVDLGTAFGLDVPVVGGPEVHVFNGEVTLATDASRVSQRLQERQAKRLEGGLFHDIPSRPEAFPDQQDLAQQEAVEVGQRRKEWLSAMKTLAKDPAAVIVYTCENEPKWSRAITNHAANAKPESHASMVGTEWTSGRWPGKHGLDFRSQGDRLRFSVPDVFSALTCIASLRVDSLPNAFNSLLMPTRYTAGAFHWTLAQGGELRVASVFETANGKSHHIWEPPTSASAITSMDFGRWVSLATTYDSASGTVQLFRDGEPIGAGRFPRTPKLLLSSMEFGNWGARRDQPENSWIENQPIAWDTRNFVGRLDELVILSRVLTPEEIQAHYQLGKP